MEHTKSEHTFTSHHTPATCLTCRAALGVCLPLAVVYVSAVGGRVILENAAVRAAAVPALAKFAARLPSLRPSIRVLIKRSLLDEDDEVSCTYHVP